MRQASTLVKNHGGKSCTILVVDDDEAMRELLIEALQEKGCRVIGSENGQDALKIVNSILPSMIVTDLRMADGGYAYLRQLQAKVPQCPIVVVTAYGTSHSKAEALKCGVQGYFEKPLHIHDLKAWICQRCVVFPCGNSPFAEDAAE